jgi:hypothetical protein
MPKSKMEHVVSAVAAPSETVDEISAGHTRSGGAIVFDQRH